MHAKATKQLSEYGRQLREKQKARWTFGLTEKSLKRLAKEARSHAGSSSDNLLIQLERRLDTVVFRAGFATTPRQARQMTTHGHFLVNGRRVDVPSVTMNPGDTIELRPKLKGSLLYTAPKQEGKPPRWLSVDRKMMQIRVQELPTSEDVATGAFDSLLITEFYSR